MNKKIILIILAVITIGGVIFYFINKNNQKSGSLINNYEIKKSLKNDWEVYQNKENNFQIEYPAKEMNTMLSICENDSNCQTIGLSSIAKLIPSLSIIISKFGETLNSQSNFKSSQIINIEGKECIISYQKEIHNNLQNQGEQYHSDILVCSSGNYALKISMQHIPDSQAEIYEKTFIDIINSVKLPK
jgi:hypothetical protein